MLLFKAVGSRAAFFEDLVVLGFSLWGYSCSGDVAARFRATVLTKSPGLG